MYKYAVYKLNAEKFEKEMNNSFGLNKSAYPYYQSSKLNN